MKTAKDLIKASVDYPGSCESNPTFDLADGDEVGDVISDLICEAEDSITYVTRAPDDTPAEVTDAWGTTDDGDEWRVIVSVLNVETRIAKEGRVSGVEARSVGADNRYMIPETDFERLAQIIGRKLTRDERRDYTEALVAELPPAFRDEV